RGLAATPTARGAGQGEFQVRKLVSATLAAALALPAPAGSVIIREDVVAAAGGIGAYYDQDNAYPATAFISMGCTGTLINARTVVTAAHCFTTQANADAEADRTSVSFSPIAGLPDSVA